MSNYITISGKKPLPKIPARRPDNPLVVSKEALRSMSKSASIYLDRIEQEQEYSKQLAKSYSSFK